MSRSRSIANTSRPPTINPRWLLRLGRDLFLGTVAVTLLLGIHSIGVAHAAREYVYSIGVLVKVDQTSITLGFDDGTTATYRIGRDTTFQGQNADERKLSDLEVGNPVMVIAAEGDSTAFTVVDGGPAGFHEAGPADIRGHEGACVCGSGPADHT